MKISRSIAATLIKYADIYGVGIASQVFCIIPKGTLAVVYVEKDGYYLLDYNEKYVDNGRYLPEKIDEKEPISVGILENLKYMLENGYIKNEEVGVYGPLTYTLNDNCVKMVNMYTFEVVKIPIKDIESHDNPICKAIAKELVLRN